MSENRRPTYLQQLWKKLNQDQDEDNYMGNIWGWKFSIFGLILIIIFVGLLVYRYQVMGIPINAEEASPFYRDSLLLTK
ncbi:MAG: hypothetical protein AAGI23_18430 [Bacteroidota bacterium]